MKKPLGTKWAKAVSLTPKDGSFLHKVSYKAPPRKVEVITIKRRAA